MCQVALGLLHFLLLLELKTGTLVALWSLHFLLLLKLKTEALVALSILTAKELKPYWQTLHSYFFTLPNNVFHTQLAFLFQCLWDSYIIHNHILISCFFLQWDFNIFNGLFLNFSLFFLIILLTQILRYLKKIMKIYYKDGTNEMANAQAKS